MIFAAAVLAASLAVADADRLAMADRLFNRGEAAAARAEYLALRGSREIDAAELGYRIVASANAVGDKEATRREGEAFLKAFPTNAHADRVRLLAAMAAPESRRLDELRLIDRDDVDRTVRAQALYRMAEATGDAALYERSFKTDPAGRFAPYAKIAHATKLLAAVDAAERRKGVGELMDLVYGKNAEVAKDALYLAAVHSYREGCYGESSALLRKYAKAYPSDPRAQEVARMTALSELMNGKYAAAIAISGDETDETLLYVKASASLRLDMKDEARRLSRLYLDSFPDGKNRDAMELQLARMDFEDASHSKDPKAILLAAKKCHSLSGASADRMLVAWALENAGDEEGAEAEYAAIAVESPKSRLAADAMYRRAMSLLRRERWAAAELSLAEALSSEALGARRRTSALYWRGIAAFRAGHPAEAETYLKEALGGTLAIDERREARLVVADIDLAAGRTNEAVAAYSDLVRNGAVARMSAAKTLAVGKLLSGEDSKTCARALAAGNSPQWRQFGYALLGSAEEADGNLSAAADAYAKCLAEPCVTDAAASAALKLGLHLVKDGNPAEAEKVLKKAVDLNDGDREARARAYLGLAEASLLRGDTESARGYATYVTVLFENSAAAPAAKKILEGK